MNLPDDYYSLSSFETPFMVINRKTYKGWGRPRKKDYITMTYKEVHEMLNTALNMLLDTKPKGFYNPNDK